MIQYNLSKSDKDTHPSFIIFSQMQIEQKYHVGQNLDVLDTVKKWVNAEVLYCDDKEIFVHYTGWSNKYDQTIPIDSPRILQQWEFGKDIQINNRIDVHHPLGGWLQARVIQKDLTNPNKYKVHFTNYHAKYDIWVNVQDHNQVSLIGSKTKAYGIGKKRAQNLKKQLSEKAIKNLKQKIEKFLITMKSKNWVMKSIQGDGNCLFRSISHQLYGDDCYYKEIRQICMDYLIIEKAFFQDYVIEDIQAYVQRKRNDAVWGDDVEIQAISEIYCRPIQIYAFGARPIRTFHQQNVNQIEPLRLAYVGSCHYNSIKPQEMKERGILQTPFGQYERNFLRAYEQHGYHPDNIRYRNQFSNTNRIEDTIQENLEADLRQIESKNEQQLHKILQISETQSILQQIENAELKQIQNRTEMEKIQQDLRRLEERQFQEAKKLSKQNNPIRPYWFNDLKSQGFSDHEIQFAIQIKGYDPDAVQNFLLDNM